MLIYVLCQHAPKTRAVPLSEPDKPVAAEIAVVYPSSSSKLTPANLATEPTLPMESAKSSAETVVLRINRFH